MDEVHTWGKYLQVLQSREGKTYHMLMEIYSTKDLDKIDDWIEKISTENKVMGTLHVEL